MGHLSGVLRLRWKTAFTFMFREEGWREKLVLGGLLILIFPPLGWVMALGYRSLAGIRLVEGRRPTLPSWTGRLMTILRRGLAASGVILLYFTPFMILYWALALDSWAELRVHLPEIAAFVGLCAIFPPLFMPSLPVLFDRWYGWVSLTGAEVVVLVVAFLATAFVLPSVFAQVSLQGSYRGAWRIGGALRYLVCNLRTYLEAWFLSVLASAAAAGLGPLMPWGLMWSYLVILYAFNDSLSRWSREEVRRRFEKAFLLERPRMPSESSPAPQGRMGLDSA